MKAAEEMKREELIAYDKWLTRRKWGTGEIISPEKAADLYLAEQPLPPAEGAEKLQKLMTDISEWSNKTFGDGQRNPAIVYHLKKEVNELIAVFEGNPRNAHRQLWFEYADCLMLLLDSALHAGFTARDLIDATREKLEINKTRKWGKPDENGVIEHVEQPQPTAEGAEEILAKGKVLMFGHVIVDPIMLPEGIYATKELRIYLPETTIEHLLETGKSFRDKTQTRWLLDSYFDNLSKCELIDVDVVRDATLHAQRLADKMVEERCAKCEKR